MRIGYFTSTGVPTPTMPVEPQDVRVAQPDAAVGDASEPISSGSLVPWIATCPPPSQSVR